MDRSSAGISGQYARSDNDFYQPNDYATSSGRGRFRHSTVRQWDNPPRAAPGRNEFYPSSAAYSSQYLQRRSVNPAQDFNALTKQEKMDDLVSQSERVGHRYNGKNHGQYASSIKKYTSAAKRPLNRAEQSQLLRLLQNFTATRSWSWRSLTTTFHAFTSAGVFTPHKPMDQRVQRTQAVLLSTLQDAIIFKCNQKAEARDIDVRGIANLLWAMAKLVDNGQKLTPELKETVAALLPHVNALKDQFIPQNTANLLWAMAKLVDNGQERTPGFKETVAALLPNVNVQKADFKPQGIANLLWAMAKLVDNGQEQTPDLNKAVATLLPHVNAKKGQFNVRDIANLLWAMAKLMYNGQKQTPELNEAMAALLPHVNEQIDQFIPKHIANLLWAMAKMGELVELNMFTSTFESLVCKISENPQLSQQDIFMSLWGVMVCCARLTLVSDPNKNNALEKHMDALFTRLENTYPDNHEDQSMIAMAACWLGKTCPVIPHYQTSMSKRQSDFRDQLQARIPSLQIEEEKSLNSLPPVDLLLPEHNMVIEVQGPSHYVGGGFQHQEWFDSA
ncbi:hypothetical protein [Endozoicomonas sp. GU-1]|uniref:hypothetical protein n=1 Tax=Endozoicomonas sp. GU-1 TaxID=3009078 RepID=UPI0022B41FE4|nr:hypothetical protein [Endozoicomonas sp. GU-1]WBA79398.1 hypothetical protein O2T12_13480 [Endozoicomonas sp. GU-1]WBA87041.1 hypothetical protein O3276_03055 [Endozoicomonas sp. GU-1]